MKDDSMCIICGVRDGCRCKATGVVPSSDKPSASAREEKDIFDEFADEVEARIKFFTGDPEIRKHMLYPPQGFTKKDLAFVARQWFAAHSQQAEKKAVRIREFMSSKFRKEPQFTVSNDILDEMLAAIIRATD